MPKAENTFTVNSLSDMGLGDRRTLRKWLKGVPHQGGKYKLADAMPAIEAGRRASRGSVTDEKKRLVQLQGDKAEFQLNVLMKNYVPRDVVKRVLTQFVSAAKTRSFSGCSRLVTLIRMAPDNQTAIDLAKKEMTELWREMEKSEWHQSPTSPAASSKQQQISSSSDVE